MTNCLVFDLGAGSGRAMVATDDDGQLSLSEAYRFSGYAVYREDGPHWEWPALLEHVMKGIQRALDTVGRLDSIGIDSWGLDYALFDEAGNLVCEPHHYRHKRSQRGYATVPVPPSELFVLTGAQDLPVKTIYQLYDEVQHHPDRLKAADALLMVADAVAYHLTGEQRAELTLARTSGLMPVAGEAWDRSLCDRLGLPARLLQPVIRPGEKYGYVRPEIDRRLGHVPVIAVANHDTASAVASLPLERDSAFLILGSWSLIGIKQATPVATAAVRRAGFGNEGGVDGQGFLIKSLNGLHLIQKLRAAWAARTGKTLAFEALSRQARLALEEGDVPGIDPSDPLFFSPDDAISAVTTFFSARQGRSASINAGWLAATIYKGLVAEIRQGAYILANLLGRPIAGVWLCGGGAQDMLLCDLIAAALDCPVHRGPVEASAWGNALIQLKSLGRITSLDEGCRSIQKSAPEGASPQEHRFQSSRGVHAGG